MQCVRACERTHIYKYGISETRAFVARAKYFSYLCVLKTKGHLWDASKDFFNSCATDTE